MGCQKGKERDQPGCHDHQGVADRNGLKGGAHMQGQFNRQPRHQRPDFQLVPRSVAAPGILRPDGAGNHPHGIENQRQCHVAVGA